MKYRGILKRIIGMALLFTIIIGNIPIQATATAKSSKKSSNITWPKGPNPKKLSSDSAIVMELSTGTILYQKNIHKKHYPASITKIMTAMLTAENCSMDETVTFSKAAVYGIEQGSSTIYSDVGEKLTVEQCLYAIMLESANEVCLGVAEQVAGTIPAFVDKMNQRVKELGLKDTHFNNPNGLPDPKHYTTAYDMAIIARQAMKNPTFRKVAATKSYVMPKTNTHKQKRYWNNHHQMINGYKYPKYEYKYCIGGKTGYTNVARSTLVTYAEKDGMELVSVIMKADGPTVTPNEYTDSTKLLNYGFEKYKKYSIDEKTNEINKELFNNYDSYFDADASPIHLENESAVILPKGVKLSDATQKITYDKNVTLKTGENVIGHVSYTYGNKTVGMTNILYTKAANSKVDHLDEASRKEVGTEIQDIKESEKKDAQKANLWRKIKNAVVTFFSIRLVQILFLIILVAGIGYIGFCLFRDMELPRLLKRRRRSSSGYRNRRAKRNHARARRMERRDRNREKSGRRNHSKHYARKSSEPRKEKKTSKGVTYHKKHKKTKESFGKNFFDF